MVINTYYNVDVKQWLRIQFFKTSTVQILQARGCVCKSAVTRTILCLKFVDNFVESWPRAKNSGVKNLLFYCKRI